MNKNNTILATLITVIGSIVVACITNIDNLILLHLPSISLYIIIPIIIIGIIWIIYAVSKRKKVLNIDDHPIFTQFMYWKHYVEKIFEMDNKGKELLFREILIGSLQIYETKLTVLHENTKHINNIIEFKNKHLCIFYEIINELENYFSPQNYSEEDMRVLQEVIPKYNKWCNSGYSLLIEKIEEICDSSLYADNFSRNIVILLSYQIMLSIVILNTSKTLNDINGELDGKIFRGVKI